MARSWVFPFQRERERESVTLLCEVAFLLEKIAGWLLYRGGGGMKTKLTEMSARMGFCFKDLDQR